MVFVYVNGEYREGEKEPKAGDYSEEKIYTDDEYMLDGVMCKTVTFCFKGKYIKYTTILDVDDEDNYRFDLSKDFESNLSVDLTEQFKLRADSIIYGYVKFTDKVFKIMDYDSRGEPLSALIDDLVKPIQLKGLVRRG